MIAGVLLKRYWLHIAGIAAIAGAAWWAYDTGYDKADLAWRQKWDKQAKQLAEDRADAEEQQREIEQYWQSRLNEVQQNAEQKIIDLESDLNAADSVADGLRAQAERLAARASRSCNNSSSSPSSKTTETTSELLAELFARADKRAGELAEAYDRSRIAGLACEQAYDSLVKKKPQ